MKVQELFESPPPYLHDGEYSAPEELEKPTYYSDSSLSRMFIYLCDEIFENIKVSFYMLDNLKVVGVIPEKKEKTQEKSNQIVFSLRFKTYKTIINYPDDIDKSKVLQVDSVFTSKIVRGTGIASFVYAMLVERGFIVVSDTSQFEDGKQLWKKISKEAHFNDYVIHIIDDENGFVKDKSGKIIAYDSSNIDDAKIWSGGLNLEGEHILLMMK